MRLACDSARAFVVCAAWVVLCLPRPAQHTAAEDYAHQLVDSDLDRGSSKQALLLSWIELVRSEPAHPLCEAALILLQERLGESEDPRALYREIDTLEAAGMRAGAERELYLLRDRLRVAYASLEELEQAREGTWLPGYLRHWDVLGPLGPLGNPLAVLDEPQLLVAPDFGREDRWSAQSIAPFHYRIDPEQRLAPCEGWALSAARFDSDRGGPAWIEIDARGSLGLSYLQALQAQERGLSSTSGNPSYAYSFNGAPPVEVDFLRAERSALERVEVVLRKGRNQLVLRSMLGGKLSFSVRVLDHDGHPLALRAGTDERPPGEEVTGALPPLHEFPSAEAFLAGLPARTPELTTLLGLLERFDARPFAGLAHMEEAVASAPERPQLALALARAWSHALCLPDSWKRTHARELYEKIAAADAGLEDAQLELARALVPEDREEEAIARLRKLAQAAGGATAALLELERVYPRLDMQVQSEQALHAALERSPEHTGALRRAAEQAAASGRPTRALELRGLVLRGAGASAAGLLELGRGYAELGRLAQAEHCLREAALRAEDEGGTLELADFHADLQRWDEADALYAAVAARHPRWDLPCLRRADVAERRGKRADLLERLREALAREPSRRLTRERLLAIEGREATEDCYRRHAVDAQAELDAFEPARWKESVVRVLDSATIVIFPDGAQESITHNLIAVRDLDGARREGTQSLAGEVLRVATIKGAENGAGREYEPVRSPEGYVMPRLEPGDFIETIEREFSPPPADGVLEPHRWLFASISDVFQKSRWVVSVPKSLAVELYDRNFHGTHEVHDEGLRVVHVYEARDMQRVVPEPGAPPREWFLPTAEVGMRGDERAMRARLQSETLLKTRMTPALAKLARTGVIGEEGQAKQLLSLCSTLLDKRSGQSQLSANASLLTREGNAAWLYAALLRAAGLECDLVWSRHQSPEADLDPRPHFFDEGRWQGKLLVLSLPHDGTPAWCDPNIRLQPFGKLVADAPRAPAFGGLSGRDLVLPEVALEERVGTRLDFRYSVDAQRAAKVEISFERGGNEGYAEKEGLRSASQKNRKAGMSKLAAGLAGGIDLVDFELEGLDLDDEPLRYVLRGQMKSFLDESAGELSCKLPFPALRLSAQLAGGEGRRRLPYFLPRPIVATTSARIELPQELRALDPPPDVKEEVAGGHFELRFRQDGERVLVIEREVLLPCFLLAPEEYAAFNALCARIDQAERVRLRFAR